MGIDKSLSDKYPSVIVNRIKYHYGRCPKYEYYLFENAYVAKDYRWFETKRDLVAFLLNLPESLDGTRMAARYPDWHSASPERRDVYWEEDRAQQRARAEEKVRAGTAQRFSMDLEGRRGPHVPQRLDGDPLSAESSHWVVGVWHGARPPGLHERVWFRPTEPRAERRVMIPLSLEEAATRPIARPQYILAEVVDTVYGMAIVRGATRDLDYAMARAEQYERGIARILDYVPEKRLEKGRGPGMEP